jgi:D-alanyl-D-alanine carboxypeptidase/D-alanyl-D-alanine-endopeptidase (penicillin-binding protein 4)
MTPSPSTGKTRTILGVIALALTVALGAGGAYGAGLATAGLSAEVLADTVVSEPEVVAETTVSREKPAVDLAALRIPTCSLSSLLESEALGEFSGVVIDPVTNDVLFDRGMDTLLAPASVQKVLTGVAALNTLGPDTTFQTTTLSTEDPEVLVVKAGGDLTLSATPEGAASVYIGAAKLADLAEQTIAALEASLPEGERVTIRELVVDASLWDPEDNWREAWASSARTNGYISRITPLQIDGDRFNPSAVMGQRSGDPMGRAASAFVTALRQAGNSARFVSVSYEPTPEGASPLASVSSRPVSELVSYMVKESDNTLAEMLGRQISLAQGLDGSGDSVGEGLMTALASLGIPDESIVIDDASGLSGRNQLTPDFVATLLSEVLRSEGDIGLLAGALPIAGVDGSLDDRFTGDNAVAQGRVFAKTGSIQGTRSLAGWVSAEDDSDLVFAFFATGEVSDDARTALETVVTGVFSCGANLADF